GKGVVTVQDVSIGRPINNVVGKVRVFERKGRLACLRDRIVGLRQALDIDPVLVRGHIEGRARTGVMNVALVAHAQEIVVGSAVVQAAAEGLLPDSVVVFALIVELLGNFAGRRILICN